MRAKTITRNELDDLKDEDFEDEDLKDENFDGEPEEFEKLEDGEPEDDGEADEEQEADLIAASDAQSAEELPDANKISYRVKLANQYQTMDGEWISEIDLSGLEDLTTMDAQKLDRIMDKLNHYPRNRYRDTIYCKHIAVLVTGLSVDFFNEMKWVDMNRIISRISIYFLFN